MRILGDLVQQVSGTGEGSTTNERRTKRGREDRTGVENWREPRPQVHKPNTKSRENSPRSEHEATNTVHHS